MKRILLLLCVAACEGTPDEASSQAANEPANGDFGTFSLAAQIQRKRWTILFFYPGDFTFV